MDISNDPEVVINRWREDFTKLYNEFDNKDGDFDRFKREIKQNNTVLEQNMQDPLFLSNECLNHNIDIGEVKAVVAKSKLGKAVGVDQLPNKVLKKYCIITVLQKMFQLFNTRLLENPFYLEKSPNFTYTKR